MIWKGNELDTIDKLMRLGIDKCDTPEEAQQFMLEYVKENIHARSNIGYVAGYYSQADKHRIFKWFDVVHPIFGTKDLSPEELMKLGMEMGERQAHKSRPIYEERLKDETDQ